MKTPSSQQRQILRKLSTHILPMEVKAIAAALGCPEGSIRSQLMRLEKNNLVIHSSAGWEITLAGRETVDKPEANTEELPRHFAQTDIFTFSMFGRLSTGLSPERVEAISKVVFLDDCNDMSKVWENLACMNVPIDGRRAWYVAWQNHLVGDGRIERPAVDKAKIPDGETLSALVREISEVFSKCRESGGIEINMHFPQDGPLEIRIILEGKK